MTSTWAATKRLLGIVSGFIIILLLGVVSPAQAQGRATESFRGGNVASGEIIVRFRTSTVAESQALAAQDADLTSAEPVGRTGAVLVRSRRRDVAALMRAYETRPDVVYAEPNYIGFALDIPNDQFFGEQYGLLNTGQTLKTPFPFQSGTAGADISAQRAWDITEGSRAIVVGVVDTGVDYTHPDLAPNMWSAPRSFTVTIGGQTITCAEGTHGFNAITRTCDPMDDFGHGTHVAGIIGASGNNGAGVSGVNRVGTIIASKWIAANGSGTLADAIAALDFMVQVKAIFPTAANVRVLNNSWGFGNAQSQALLDVINLTAASDMLFVASAANSALNNDLSPQYPSNFSVPNMIAVAATDNRDALASFSDWGPARVHLGAPGVNVLSTWPNGTYAYLSGTSMSAPMVSGAAALVLSACPLSTASLKFTLNTTVDRIPSLLGRTVSEGRLNVYRAVSSCGVTQPSPLTLSVTPGALRLDQNASVNLTVAASSVAGVNLTAFSLPSGVTATFTPSSIAGGTGSATLRLTASASAPEGTYLIGISGSSGSASRSTGVLLTVGSPSVLVGQTISGTLTAADGASQDRLGKHADFYKLTLDAATTVTIDLKSRYFDPFLYVLSSTGAVLFSDDQLGGNNNARITQTLAAGTYFLQVTTFSDGAYGDYTLSINTPTITSITPSAGSQGSSVTINLVGTRFLAPMTLSAGAGIVVNNVTVLSPTAAIASLTIAPDASFTPRDLTVTTSQGTSNPVTFVVPSPISIGQRISGELSATDRVSPLLLYRYTDLYQFSVSSTTTVAIDMRSPTITVMPILISSTGVNLAQGFVGLTSTVTLTIGPGTYVVQATAGASLTTGAYTLSINLPALTSANPVFLTQGSTTDVTLTGARFASPMTVNAGTGISVGSANVLGTTSARAPFAVAADAPVGPRNVTVTTPEGVSNPITVRVVPPIPSINLGQPVTGTLSPTDPPTGLYGFSPTLPTLFASNSYADLYQISLPATTTVTITLQSAAFNTVLSVWTATGPAFVSNPAGSGPLARLTATLIGGLTYYIEVTSLVRATGDYTLSVTPLVITQANPNVGARGSTVVVTLTGNGFASPMTINAGAGISASEANVVSPTSATVSLTIAPDAPLGARDLTATTANGTSGPVTFTVIPSITSLPLIRIGDTASGTLASNDQAAPHRAGQYGDLYQLTITAETPVNIDMRSTAFTPFLFLLSSTGVVMGSDGGTNARVSLMLSPGTYLVEATSSVAGIGNYTLSVAPAGPIMFAAPASSAPGRSFNVTLKGQFFVTPMTLVGDASVTVSSFNVTSSTSATMTVTVAPNASLSDHLLTGTTIHGTGTLPFTVTPSSLLNFPRLLTAVERATTGFAIVNPGPVNAAVTFLLYSAAGVQLGVSNQTVPARGQLAILGSELFPTAIVSGWVQARSSAVGLHGIWLGGDFTTIMDGADAGAITQEMIFPLLPFPIAPEYSLANAGSEANNITLRIYGAGGLEVGPPASVTLPVNGAYRNFATVPFPGPFTANPTYVRVTGTRNFTGTSVINNYQVTPSWTVVNGIETIRPVTELNFPHVPSGPQGAGSWISTLGITNVSSASQVVTITFTPNSGNPVSVSRTLLPGGSLSQTVQTMFGFPATAYQDGWVKVTGPASMNGYVAIAYTATSGATAVPGQSTPQTSMIFDHVANGPQWSTGIALLNNTSTDANVEVYIMRKSGDLVGKASLTLARGTKIAKQLTELIPASNADDGFVFVRSTNNVPLYGIELFYSRDNRVIANVPAGAIDPSITYTPPPAP